MKTLKRVLALQLLLVLSGALPTALAGEQHLLLTVKKGNYAKVQRTIEAVGGTVQFAYKYCEMLAATVPEDAVATIIAHPAVSHAMKDQDFTLSDPPAWGRPTLQIPTGPGLQAEHARALTPDQLVTLMQAPPQNYSPLTNTLVGAEEFYAEVGHFGEGITIAIIDGGISTAAIAVAGRIVGGENLTDDGIPATSPSNFSHGTAVACCAGASAIFGLPTVVTDAIKLYAPSSVITDYFGPGIDGVPMIGTAPGAQFYALKVIRADGSALLSYVTAGIERAIELKELYDEGSAEGVNIQVANLSLGFVNLYAGGDPVFSPLVKRALEAGIILTVSSGNAGPNGMTVFSPGDCKNILTVGASIDAPHDRILFELFGGLGPGGGALFRPTDSHLMTDFSSRGPTADGRADPEIIAPGRGRMLQIATGGITWGVGTSFSAPTVAGAAALLLSAHPGATPGEIRGALLAGADPEALGGNPGLMDQGYGLLDVMSAHQKFGAFNPRDLGKESPQVRANLAPFHLDLINSDAFSGSTGWLEPGERREYFIPTTQRPLSGLDITVTITPELPPAEQNQLYGDDALTAINTAKTAVYDPVGGGYFSGTQTFALDPEDLDHGLTRVAIMGSWTNIGRVKADLSVTRRRTPPRMAAMFSGKVSQSELKYYPFTVPEDVASMSFLLTWQNEWEAWPTNELDIRLYDPDGSRQYLDNNGDNHLDGSWLDAPERITVFNPAPGQWTAEVQGYTVWEGKEHYTVFSDLGMPPLAKGATETSEGVPETYLLEQNFPNPFNPSTVMRYGLPEEGWVRLALYNLLGQEVALLVDELQPAGYHQLVFTDPGLASGAYFYRLTANGFVAARKLVLVK